MQESKRARWTDALVRGTQEPYTSESKSHQRGGSGWWIPNGVSLSWIAAMSLQQTHPRVMGKDSWNTFGLVTQRTTLVCGCCLGLG